MSNILEVTFGEGQTFATATRLWKGDYGQILLIHGPTLPAYYEVHFASTKADTPQVQVGTPEGVLIPNKFLQTDGYIYAWTFLHTGENDGETKYQIKIPVEDKGIPIDQETPEEKTAVQQAIEALNEETGKAAAAADVAEQHKDDAEDAATLAESWAVGDTGTREGEDQNNAKFWAEEAGNAASNASASATQAQNIVDDAFDDINAAKAAAAASASQAATSATVAASSATAAMNANTAAEQAKTAAAQSATNAANSANNANTKAGEAAQSATSARDSAATATQAASEASASAMVAAQSATNAGSAASAAAASATAAGNAQTAAETAQGKAEDAQEAAETAQAAAEAAAASVSASAAQIAQNTEDVADLKSALNCNKIVLDKTDKYFSTSGTTIDPTSPSTSQNFDCAVVNCSAGDAFTIHAGGSSTNSLPYVFIDSSNNVLLKSSVIVADEIVIAPQNSAKLILNNRKADYPNYTSYYGKMVAKDISDANDEIDKLNESFNVTSETLEKYGHTSIIPELEVGGLSTTGKYDAANRFRTVNLIKLDPGVYFVDSPDNVYVARFSDTNYSDGVGAGAWGVSGRNAFTVTSQKPYVGFMAYPDNNKKPLVYIEINTAIDVLRRDINTAADVLWEYGHGISVPVLEPGAVSLSGKYNAADRWRTKDLILLTPGKYYINAPDNVYMSAFSGADYSGGQGLPVWGVSGRQEFTVSATRPYIGYFGYPDPTTKGEPYIYIESNTIINSIKSTADKAKDDIDIIKGTIPQFATGTRQIARLGWKPYAGYYPPEQSVDSYKLAYDMGMRILLADLRKTSDDVFVCIHDATINDVARNNDGTMISEEISVSGHTLEELNQYNYGIKKGWPNRGILTLEQFLQTCARLNCAPVIELKIWLQEVEVNAVVDLVRKYGLQDSLIWFEGPDTTIATRTCTIIRNKLPNATVMIMGSNTPATAIATAALFSGADKKTAISNTDLSTLTSSVLEDCRSNNIDIAFFQIDNTADMDTAYASGVFDEIKFWVSSEINIHDYLVSKI